MNEGIKPRLRPHRQSGTYPVKFENATLFLWLGLPSTLIRRDENGASQKRSSNRGNLKTSTLRLWTEKVLEMELIENDDLAVIMRFF